MTLIEIIATWQNEATLIPPAIGSDRKAALGGLPGPSFFPEGFGLSNPSEAAVQRPTIMAIGHNFGCEAYREQIKPAGREDDKATWRNLDSLLRRAGSTPEEWFRTNWFVGLLPGDKQTGRFLRNPDAAYEQACRVLLVKQIKELRPKAVFLLGPEVASRAYQIMPSLTPWRNAKKWSDIDSSSIGHSPRGVEVPEAKVRTNITALLHPSFGAANQGRRMKSMPLPQTEVEIVRAALGSSTE